ncbi:phosphoserine phosphatase SerB [Pseudopelagicola sp. nBUS_19]|uniref:phosphoserine phosphatase SerB n=1 Tax=unclassified Pseudopelagicola TaxID=2649563 RepID=UPI003EBC3F4E
MFVAILMTDPSNPSLDLTLINSLRNAWGGEEVQWLAMDEAAQFALQTIPDNRWEVWENLQSLGVDLVILPSQNRIKKILLADMDSTMIQQECIDELANEAGVGARVTEITAKAMNGELNFESALTERVRLLEGLDERVIQKVITERIVLMPGGKALLATMKAEGAYSALVSGGFTAFTAEIAAKLGFDENHANTLLSAGGLLTGKVKSPILGKEAKVRALHEITTRLGLVHDDVMAVGDGANDLGMLKLAGAGVALHAKPSVGAQCDIRINHGDLTALLYIQGYEKSRFQT